MKSFDATPSRTLVLRAERGDRLPVALDELGWTTQRRITRGQLDAWFSHRTPGPEQRPDYASQLRTHLSASEVATVEATLRKLLTGELVGWHSAAVLLVAERPA